MAIRWEPDAELVFGIMADAEVVATHARIRDNAGANPVVKQLTAAVTAAVGERLVMPVNMLDLVFPAGQFTNAFMSNVALADLAGVSLQVDLMTDDSTVVSDSGYSQQTHDGWTASQEND